MVENSETRMSTIPSRITQHTLVAVVLLCCGVIAPILLLMRTELGSPATVVGIGLLAAGCSSVVSAAFSRCFDRSKCSALQYRLILVSPWLLNPVFVTMASLQFNCGIPTAVWWNGLPLAAAVSVLSGCVQLTDGDPQWQHEGCPPRASFLFHWFFSRIIFVFCPLFFVSFQIAFYVSSWDTLPQGSEIGLVLVGICMLVGAKIVAMCACLAFERLAPAIVMFLMLAADWMSSLHLLTLVGDEAKTKILLFFLATAGVVQLRAGLARLSLCSRWSRVLARRRAGIRDFVGNSSTITADVELGAHINAGVSREIGHSIESSDSDDERGPGTLPDGFFEALVCVLGVPQPRAAGSGRRQFLCGLRSAVVNTGPNRAGASAPRASLEGNAAAVSTSKPLVAVTSSTVLAKDDAAASEEPPSGGSPKPPIDIPADDRVCTVCQDEIRTGDLIRPLPKCTHIFHADCLERWAKTMREATRCPTCRRPALARRASEGAVSIQVLTACGDERDSSTASSRSRSADANVSRGRAATNRSGSGAGRGRAGASRSVNAGRGGRQGGGGRRGASAAGQPGTRPSRQQTVYQVGVRSPAAAALSASLAVSEAMAIAALDCSAGAPNVAAHVLLEHKAILQAKYGPSAQVSVVNVPDGVAEAFVINNPDLAHFQAALQRQLGSLYRSGCLPATPWADLTMTGRVEVFRVALLDVTRKLDSRGS